MQFLTLAYHRYSSFGLLDTGPSEVASLVFNLKLLPKRPFFLLEVDRGLTRSQDTAKIGKVSEAFKPIVEATYGIIGATRSFSKCDVQEIVGMFKGHCCASLIW